MLKKFGEKTIMFNPVLIEGYVDENQVFQYYFKPICMASKDNFNIIDTTKILYASSIDASFKSDYIEYQKIRIQKQLDAKEESERMSMEETDSSNVVQLGKRQLH